MPLETHTGEETEELSATQKGELIERVATSEHFRRALRLQKFLLYVGKASTHEGVTEIREQDIGVKVFGRSPDYDRGADNIVRVNATELRKRIDHYFAEEGLSEPYIFQIPRGAYRLVFHRRTLAPPPQTHPEPIPVAPPQPQHRGWMWLSVVLALLCAVLAGTLYYVKKQDNTATDSRPQVMRFWRDFTRDYDPATQTDIVLSDESLSLMEDILRHPINLPEYVDRSYTNTIDTALVSDDRKADVREILQHNLVTLGAVMAARQILILPKLTQHFHLTVPRLYPPDMMKRNNLIVVGGKKSNPWAGFFDGQMNFLLEYDTKTSQNYVLNRHPQGSEKSSYFPSSQYNIPSGVAIIAYIPNATNTGEVLLLMGSDSDATAAASDFMTSEASMNQLIKLLGKSPLPHFEAVIQTTRLSGTSFSSQIIASRIH